MLEGGNGKDVSRLLIVAGLGNTSMKDWRATAVILRVRRAGRASIYSRCGRRSMLSLALAVTQAAMDPGLGFGSESRMDMGAASLKGRGISAARLISRTAAPAPIPPSPGIPPQTRVSGPQIPPAAGQMFRRSALCLNSQRWAAGGRAIDAYRLNGGEGGLEIQFGVDVGSGGGGRLQNAFRSVLCLKYRVYTPFWLRLPRRSAWGRVVREAWDQAGDRTHG